MRLNKYLASCGVASRRKCDELINDGKVTVNGVVAQVGAKVNKRDEICVNGKAVNLPGKVYYVMYKPINVLTTLDDPRGRPTIAHYLKEINYRVFPVGRLDFDSEGLLFLTNDGDLAHKVQHPKYKTEKEYVVEVNKKITGTQKQEMEQGIILDEGKTSPAKVQLLEENVYEVIIHQGWHRQIRRMFEYFEIEVVSLKRTRIGNLSLNYLKPGECRLLKQEEVKELKEIFKN